MNQPKEEFKYICDDPLSYEPSSRLCSIVSTTKYKTLVMYKDCTKQWVPNDCVRQARIVS